MTDMKRIERLPATEEQIKKWLLDYAWFGSEETKVHEVNCIMSQDEWKSLDLYVEKYMGTRFGDEHIETVHEEANDWALSALYECHMGPHIDTCPHKHPDED